MENKNSTVTTSTVKRLKHYFDILTTEFGKHFDFNKTSPKYNQYSGEYTKGVESDYIRIYRMGLINKKQFSFGFSITNPEDSDKSLIQVNYKIGEEVSSGKIYKFENFKEKMKEFVNLIAILKGINNKNSEAIKQSIHTIFEFDSQKSTDLEILKECKSKILENSKELENSLKKSVKSYNSIKEKLVNSNKEIENFKNTRVKELGIDKLELELKKLREILSKELKEQNLKYKTQTLLLEERNLSYKVREIEQKKNHSIKSILNLYPSHIKKMYEKEVETNKKR
jgi:hypothetical protein